MAKKYYKITKFHKMYFRFLKENGLMGKLNKERLMTRRNNPLLFMQNCRLGVNKTTKWEYNNKWLELVDNEYKRITSKILSDFIESDAPIRVFYKNLTVKEHLIRIVSQLRSPIQINNEDIVNLMKKCNCVTPFHDYFSKRLGGMYWQPYEVIWTVYGLDLVYGRILKEKIANAE